MRCLLPSTGLRVGYVAIVTGYHVNGQCDSVYCSVSLVLMVQLQGGMKRTTHDVGTRWKRRGGELCSSWQLSLHRSCVLLSIRCSQSMHTRLSLLSMYTYV